MLQIVRCHPAKRSAFLSTCEPVNCGVSLEAIPAQGLKGPGARPPKLENCIHGHHYGASTVCHVRLGEGGGFLSAYDTARINKLFRKANKYRYWDSHQEFDALLTEKDQRLFQAIQGDDTHPLYPLLQKTNSMQMRPKGHNFS